jgi:hypothetical protein
MAKKTTASPKEKVITVLNQARALELQAIHQYMNQHYNLDDMDFDNVAGHVERLGAVYLAKIAGTSSATGLNTMGFVARRDGGAAEWTPGRGPG